MMQYEKQLETKQELVKDAFKKTNKYLSEQDKPEICINQIIASPLQQWYRNKIEFSFWVYKQQNLEFRKQIGEWKDETEILKQWIQKYDINCNQCCGFHKQWEFAKIVNIDSCWLISSKMNQVFKTIKDLLIMIEKDFYYLISRAALLILNFKSVRRPHILNPMSTFFCKKSRTIF